ITYAFIDPRTNRPFSTSTFTDPANNLLAFQRDFSQNLSQNLKLTLDSSQREPLEVRGTRVLAAYSLYIRGRGYLADYGAPENIDEAIKTFKESLNFDPNYADAHAAIGEALWRKYIDTGNPDWIAEARDDCEHSITLDPNLAAARTCLGAIYNSMGDYRGAIEQFDKATQADPTNDVAYR